VGRGIGSFFLGGCTFLAYRWVLGRDERGRITAAVIGAAAALWLVTLYCSYNDLSLNTHPYLRVFAWKYPVVVLFPITILALALAETYRGALGRRLAVLGDISYSSYLWHFPLQLAFGVAVHTLGLTTEVYKSPLTFVLFFAMLIGLSMASYRYIEMPTQSYLRRRWVERSAKGQLA
jgi:peptidoglycan/LPS O-acetylase OafA/YrhL